MCYASCCHAFELLTLVLVHLPLLPFQSLWTWMGDDFCTVILFVNADTLHLVWLPSRSEVPWCGHRCALPISWSHKWELCICGRPVFLSTYISKMCGLTGLQRCYSSQYTPYTIHVSIDVDRHVNFVHPSIHSHSVSFVFFFTQSCSCYTVLELTCILLSLQTKVLP